MYVLIVCSITHVRLCPPREEGMERRGTVSTFPKCYVRSCAPLYAVRATRRSRESWERERDRTGGWRPCKFSLWQSFLSSLPPLLPLFFQKRSVPQLPLFLPLDGETPPFLPPLPQQQLRPLPLFGGLSTAVVGAAVGSALRSWEEEEEEEDQVTGKTDSIFSPCAVH